jgi:Molybdopterin-binding protein
MKVSARNLIPGKIKEITMGPVNAEVVVEVAPGIEVVSVITAHSVKSMGPQEGFRGQGHGQGLQRHARHRLRPRKRFCLREAGPNFGTGLF